MSTLIEILEQKRNRKKKSIMNEKREKSIVLPHTNGIGLLLSAHLTDPPGVTTEQGMSTLSPGLITLVIASFVA